MQLHIPLSSATHLSAPCRSPPGGHDQDKCPFHGTTDSICSITGHRISSLPNSAPSGVKGGEQPLCRALETTQRIRDCLSDSSLLCAPPTSYADHPPMPADQPPLADATVLKSNDSHQYRGIVTQEYRHVPHSQYVFISVPFTSLTWVQVRTADYYGISGLPVSRRRQQTIQRRMRCHHGRSCPLHLTI